MRRPTLTTPTDSTTPEPPASQSRVHVQAPEEPRECKEGPPREPPREAPPELLVHLQSRAVFDRLVGFVVRKSIPRRDATDLVQQSLLEAWQKRHSWGPTTTDLDKLLYTVTDCNVSDHKKRWARSRLAAQDPRGAARGRRENAERDYQGHDGPEARDGTGAGGNHDDDEPSDVQPSLVTKPAAFEARGQLRAVNGFIEKSPSWTRAAGWLMRNLRGESLAEIAASAGTTENAVTTAVSRLRAALRQGVKDGLIVLLIAAFVGLVMTHMRHRNRDDVSHPPPPEPVTAPPQEPAPDPAPTSEADALRRRAFDACNAMRWIACRDALDRAAVLDPAGDGEPRVREARAAAGRGIAHDEQPR